MATSKTFLAGTHRTVDPAATVDRVRPLLPRMGITRLADVTGLDRLGLPVVLAIRPNARSVAVAMGKGQTRAAAMASAMMEAAETWHAERILHPLRYGRADELATRLPLVDLDRLARHAAAPEGELPPMLWIEGRALPTGAAVWLPFETVHADYAHPLPPGSGCFAASSNGLASGNHRLEAICHGLYEVIERDAVTLWFRQPPEARAASAIDLATVDDPDAKAVLARIAAAGCGLRVWDATSDLGLPVCLALLVDEALPDGHTGLGAGCHAVREVAFSRAVLEAAQVRMTYISGARDDLLRHEFAPAGRLRRGVQTRALMAGAAPRRRFGDLPSRLAGSFEDDLAWVTDRLAARAAGPAIVVDLDRPELGLAVVRVVVPGLEGPDDHPGYRPGSRALRGRHR